MQDNAGLRIELTWQDNFDQLPEELRPPGMPAYENWRWIYEQKLVIERSRDSPRLTVTFSEGLHRSLNAHHFLYAERQGWPFDQQALFAATDHTQTYPDVQKILLTSGQWGISRNEMQLVLQGERGEEFVTISDRFRLTNGLKRELAQRLTEGLHLRHALVGGVHEYSV